jgi:hypothetical protein
MTAMSEPQKPVEMMTQEELANEVRSLRTILEGVRETVAKKDRTIEILEAQAKRYFQAASDYVPPPENDYD